MKNVNTVGTATNVSTFSFLLLSKREEKKPRRRFKGEGFKRLGNLKFPLDEVDATIHKYLHVFKINTHIRRVRLYKVVFYFEFYTYTIDLDKRMDG